MRLTFARRLIHRGDILSYSFENRKKYLSLFWDWLAEKALTYYSTKLFILTQNVNAKPLRRKGGGSTAFAHETLRRFAINHGDQYALTAPQSDR